jgi:rSAM/selenodomain-associated transferase 1
MDLLGLFAKWPHSGQVKTRLAATVGTTFAQRIAEAFLRDSLLRYNSLSDFRVVLFSPPECENSFAELIPSTWQLWPQGEGDLGDRLERFFRGAFQQGADRIVALGADSPTLPVEYVRRAFDLLSASDIVIGPACDGGYYLIGLSSCLTSVFVNIPWSQPTVLRQTVARVGNRRLALLPVWYDVDTVQDLEMLHGHIAAYQLAQTPIDFPNTARLLEEL